MAERVHVEAVRSQGSERGSGKGPAHPHREDSVGAIEGAEGSPTFKRLSLRCGPLRVDLLWQTVCIGDAEIALTPSRFRLLAYLVINAEHPVTVSELARTILKRADPGAENAVRVAVAELRRALGPASTLIQTVRGVGYRFTGMVTNEVLLDPPLTTDE